MNSLCTQSNQPHGALQAAREWFITLWTCRIWGMHAWTCAAEQGISADDLPEVKALMDAGKTIAGFRLYATMYCKRCGYIYRGR